MHACSFRGLCAREQIRTGKGKREGGMEKRGEGQEEKHKQKEKEKKGIV